MNDVMVELMFPNGEKYEFEKDKPVVVLGANGSGKTRLGVAIEELNDPNFNCKNNEYPQEVLNRLHSDVGGCRERILEALELYLPKLPQ